MALIQNDRGQWAWVCSADEAPSAFHDTKELAIESAGTIGAAATLDECCVVDGAVTTERGEWR